MRSQMFVSIDSVSSLSWTHSARRIFDWNQILKSHSLNLGLTWSSEGSFSLCWSVSSVRKGFSNSSRRQQLSTELLRQKKGKLPRVFESRDLWQNYSHIQIQPIFFLKECMNIIYDWLFYPQIEYIDIGYFYAGPFFGGKFTKLIIFWHINELLD